MPGKSASLPESPRLVFGSAGASASSSALCSVPSRCLALHASGPNVVVVDASSAIPRVSALLSTRLGGRVSGVAACVEPETTQSIAATAALADGGLAVWVRDQSSWGNASIVEATGGGGKNATPLVSICVVYSQVEGCYSVVTAAMDDARGAGLCVLWQFESANSETRASQSATTPRNVACTRSSPSNLLPECVAATYVGGSLVVALAGTDRAVRLYYRDEDSLAPLVSPLIGHRDWVRGLCFSQQDGEDQTFQLATSSTDSTVRIWRFEPEANVKTKTSLPHPQLSDDELFFENEGVNRARIPFQLCGRQWTATLDGLLAEHDHAVLSVMFSDDAKGRLSLLTASVDGSVAIWNRRMSDDRPLAQELAPWTVSARFGLLGGAGAAALGFSSAVFVAQRASRVLAHTLGGSVHSWRLAEKASSGDGPNSNPRFVAESAPGGHIGAVNAVAWDPSGRYLLSCGEDKTTRVFAPFPSPSSYFVEWARPQVHGHAIGDIAFLDANGKSLASVSDEKVVRLFDAPEQFVCPGVSVERENVSSADDRPPAISASLPELGLSNKPVYGQSADPPSLGDSTMQGGFAVDEEGGEDGPVAMGTGLKDEGVIESFGASRDVNSAPLEIELRQNRLWPERAKLYGHGNDVSCLAVDLANGVLASASRAQASRDAFIILWDTETGLERARLFAHDLTINQMRFSSDGECLLSVARDRSFAVFRRAPQCGDSYDKYSYSLSVRVEESHGRLLHAACWMQNDRVIVTGSRDKTLKLWHWDGDSAIVLLSKKFSSGVSALDALSIGSTEDEFVAIGLEGGEIHIARVQLLSASEANLTLTAELSANVQCCGRVQSLSWRPTDGIGDSLPGATHQFAVASADYSVRVFEVVLAG